MLSILCYDKGNEKSLVIWSFWKPFKRILEIILISRLCEHSQNLPAVGGDSLPRGKVSTCPQQHSCTLSFVVMIKGIENSLVIWRYWKQFLLSHPYEHSQYLPVVQGDSLPRGKVPPPTPPHYPHVRFHFYVMIKGMRRAWLFEVSESPSRRYWKQFSCLVCMNIEFTCGREGQSTLG